MEVASGSGLSFRTKLGSTRTTDRSTVKTRRIVYIGTALYVGIFVVAAVISYLAYDVARLDLGNMVQLVWSTAHGHFLEATTASGRQATRFGGHVDPFLALPDRCL